MKLKTAIVKKLRNSLPAGFGPVLQKRLSEKGDFFTLAYIYFVLDPNDPRTNNKIIDEAISYLGEYKLEQFKKEEEILSLTK